MAVGTVGRKLGLVLAASLVIAPLCCDRELWSEAVEPAANHTERELRGPSGAPVVVMIHGASGPMRVWDPLVAALTPEGLRTLRYDLFGRGASGRPAAAYDLSTYLPQLESWLQSEGLAAESIHLVGSSMGAIIASAWATAHPERVRSLSLIGPAGFALEASPLAKLTNLPILGDYAMRVAGDRTLAQHHRRYFFAPEALATFSVLQTAFEAQLTVPGTKSAVLATLRHAPLQAFLDGYAAVGKLAALPKQVIWGKEDRAFPFEHHTELLKRLPGAQFLAVDAAGHLPQYERPEIVGPAVANFIKAAGLGIIPP